MSDVVMIVSIDFIRPDAAREALSINVVTNGVTPSDQMIADIIADEIKEHLAKHHWEPSE